MQDLVAAIKWLEKHDTTKYNIQSISTAKLGATVVGALAGKKAKATADDFLPFDTRKLKKENGATDESLKVLRRLMKTTHMSGRAIAMFVDELKMASMREDSSS